MDNKKTVGSRIKNILEKRGMQAKELAEKIGVSQAAMSNYLNDKRNIDNNYLSKIAEVLDVTTDELLGVVDKKASRINRLNAGLNALLEESMKQYEGHTAKKNELIYEIINSLAELDSSQLDIILNLSKSLIDNNRNIKTLVKAFNDEVYKK